MIKQISGTPRSSQPNDQNSSHPSSGRNSQAYPTDVSSLVEAESRRRSGSTGTIGSDGGGIFSDGGGSNSGTASLNHIGLNYINSILGSGIVGIPYALHKAGFGFGLFLLISLAFVTDYSLSLLVKSANLAGVTSYQDLVHVAFGRPGFYLLTLLQFIYPFIAMISYNVIIGDTVTKVFKRLFALSHSNILANRNSIVFISTIFVTLPLSLQKDIAKMSRVSMVSLLLIIYITLFVIMSFGRMSDLVGTNDDSYTFIGGDITQSIGVIVFAYMCHHSSFLLYGSLENPTQLRWDTVTHASVGISCLIVVVFGTAGYATFKSFSQGDLFENYCLSDDGANTARLLFTITIMLTYPIECFVVREVLENVFWPYKELLTKRHHLMLTIAIVTVTFILSTFTDCLGIVLELNGVATALPLAFILPSLCYMKLETGKVTSKKKIYALLLAIFGTSVTLIGTLKVFANLFFGHTSSNCSHGHELDYCLANKTSTLALNSTLTSIMQSVTSSASPINNATLTTTP